MYFNLNLRKKILINKPGKIKQENVLVTETTRNTLNSAATWLHIVQQSSQHGYAVGHSVHYNIFVVQCKAHWFGSVRNRTHIRM